MATMQVVVVLQEVLDEIPRVQPVWKVELMPNYYLVLHSLEPVFYYT